MARHLDLEEQEKLDELKHFWNKWGNLITWLLIAVLGAYAAWNGWQYWQRQQALRASALYDEVERAAIGGDAARVEQALKDIQEKFGGTTYAQHASLLAARLFAEKDQTDAATSALRWVAKEAPDKGVQAVARLRLAALLVQARAYDEALQQLASGLPAEFEALAADRRGDIYNLQDKKEQAKAEYLRAWKGFGPGTDYRVLVEVKLTALGVDVQALQAQAESART